MQLQPLLQHPRMEALTPQSQFAPAGLHVHVPSVHWPSPVYGWPPGAMRVTVQLTPLDLLAQIPLLHAWHSGQAVQVPPQPSLAPPHLPVQLGVQQLLLWQTWPLPQIWEHVPQCAASVWVLTSHPSLNTVLQSA